MNSQARILTFLREHNLPADLEAELAAFIAEEVEAAMARIDSDDGINRKAG